MRMTEATVSPEEKQALIARLTALEGENEQMRQVIKKIIKWLDCKADKSDIATVQRETITNTRRHNQAMAELDQMMSVINDRLAIEAAKSPYSYAVATAQW